MQNNKRRARAVIAGAAVLPAVFTAMASAAPSVLVTNQGVAHDFSGNVAAGYNGWLLTLVADPGNIGGIGIDDGDSDHFGKFVRVHPPDCLLDPWEETFPRLDQHRHLRRGLRFTFPAIDRRALRKYVDASGKPRLDQAMRELERAIAVGQITHDKEDGFHGR